MSSQTATDWPYPGSRWWKFDFHTHTPASSDFVKSTREAPVSPEAWLLGYMAAGVDCVAITDHNSGAWVDKLKAVYEDMKQQAAANAGPDGFRELTLFPGVELSVNGGFHLLAILDPNAGRSDIDALLGQVGYQGTKGDSDDVTRKGAAEVVRDVLEAGALPIPAHADADKGLLRSDREDVRACQLDPNTVRQVLDEPGILAMEWGQPETPKPSLYEERRLSWSEVLGSDYHGQHNDSRPGSRFTWVKIAEPSLEGLRLALLDGNGVSIRRSDEGEFEPFKTPPHFISSIEVRSARFMGNGTPETVALSPFYNAVIGGRGTGKSTLVHALRLAYRRDRDLQKLSKDADPYRQFENFAKPVTGRDGDGALRKDTEINVELMREGVLHRLWWRQDGTGSIVEERDSDGKWRPSFSEAIHAERFPIRMLSQGQIAAMAGDNRQALLDILDDEPSVAAQHQIFAEAKNTYLYQRARLRELEGRLAGRQELRRKLSEVNRKLEAFTQSHHADVLKAHQQTVRQRREIDNALEQLKEMPGRIQAFAQDLLLDDWMDGTFDVGQDADALMWRREVDQAMSEALEALEETAQSLSARTQALVSHNQLLQWRQRVDRAQADYDTLQVALEEQGVSDPRMFGDLVQERQRLEAQDRELEQLQQEMTRLQAENETQWQRVFWARRAIAEARAAFVETALKANAFVKMEIVPFGFDARVIERSLRALLDVEHDGFETDILRSSAGEPEAGLAFELAHSGNREKTLDELKERMINLDKGLGGHFRNYLERKLTTPEFADHIRCWFPEDDLRIQYNRGGNQWAPIREGSQGQRSAALLAFLLAFGDEPLVLDQPEDDLDNHLIYDLIVRQIRQNKLRRQLIIVTHNPNVVVNGDAEMVHALNFNKGQCWVVQRGALQDRALREEVCQVMEGGREAFARRWARLGQDPEHV